MPDEAVTRIATPPQGLVRILMHVRSVAQQNNTVALSSVITEACGLTPSGWSHAISADLFSRLVDATLALPMGDEIAEAVTLLRTTFDDAYTNQTAHLFVSRYSTERIALLRGFADASRAYFGRYAEDATSLNEAYACIDELERISKASTNAKWAAFVHTAAERFRLHVQLAVKFGLLSDYEISAVIGAVYRAQVDAPEELGLATSEVLERLLSIMANGAAVGVVAAELGRGIANLLGPG